MSQPVMQQVLSLLDDMATRPTTMGWDDIGDLCKAREILAAELGAVYNENTSRYTTEKESK